jgi:putative DNA methylase
MNTPRKKLIEVALPLEAINREAAREKSIRHGHPSTLHLWWARRPLAAARAVIFAQMVDDPGSVPEEFPTPEAQAEERQRLFRLIEDLVLWENTTNEDVLNRARAEIKRSWARWCKESGEDPEKLPPFHDPFAGGGALPLEAQRLGLEAHASDLNPVAVMINKAMIEIPPRFAGRPPINQEARKDKQIFKKKWHGAAGLAEDVRYYGQWMHDEAEKRIGHLYPKVKVLDELAKDRPDLKPYVGQNLTVIAWLWARTVESSNPAYRGCQVPLISSFWLSTKPGKETWVEPCVDGKTYRFEVRTGKPRDKAAIDAGTKLGRGANFRCVLSQSPLSPDYIKAEGTAGRMGARLIAIVADGDRGRVYLPPTEEHEDIPAKATTVWMPEGDIPSRLTGGTCYGYGLTTWGSLFTPRQLMALTTFSDLAIEVREKVKRDAVQMAAHSEDEIPLRDGGSGVAAYAEAIVVYCGLAVSKSADYNSSLVLWSPGRDQAKSTFARQALPMVWDYAEVNPLAGAAGDVSVSISGISRVLAGCFASVPGIVVQLDARTKSTSAPYVVSTDPPYYDNIGYADLSDFFYVWLRRSMRSVSPNLFTTLVVPKAEELVAASYRHGSRDAAEKFFLDGMTQAMRRLAQQAHPAFPVSVYYAFKQSEMEGDEGSASTGWETFLDALIRAGFGITGTWPMRTERGARSVGIDTNVLASSIVLVCRPRSSDAPMATRKDFLSALRRELPPALRQLQQGNIAPVDLAQASIGPGMAAFSRYGKILETDGSAMKVRTALQLINQTLDEVLAEQEGDFDPETAWAVAWFEQFGFNDGPFGDAETLSKAKNTALNALADAGIVKAGGGKTRLMRVDELPADWDPVTKKRLTVWEMVHHLIRVMNTGGETSAAALVAKLGGTADTARELAYRLYSVCERRKRAQEALGYNALVQSWPEITRLAREGGKPRTEQGQLFGRE